MWERIASASGLMIGAIVLFALFTTILFVYENKVQKKSVRRYKKKTPYIVSPTKEDEAA